MVVLGTWFSLKWLPLQSTVQKVLNLLPRVVVLLLCVSEMMLGQMMFHQVSMLMR